MINLVVTIFGGLMIIAGFYAMSFGFATPPNILLFFLGLIMAVAGLFLVIIFSSGIEFSTGAREPATRTVPQTPPVMKARPKPVKVEKKVWEEEKKKETLETIEKIKPQPRIRTPKKVDRPEMVPTTFKEEEEPIKKPSDTIGTRGTKPQKKTSIGASPPDAAFEKPSTEEEPIEKPEPETPEEIKPVKKKKTLFDRARIRPKKKEDEVEIIPEPEKTEAEPAKTEMKPEIKPETEPVPKPEPVKPETVKPEIKPETTPETVKTEPEPEIKPEKEKAEEAEKPKAIPRIRRPVMPKKKAKAEPEIIVEHEEAKEEPKVEEPKEEPKVEEAKEESKLIPEPRAKPEIKPVKEIEPEKTEPEQKEYRKIKPVKSEEAKKPVIKRPDTSRLRSGKQNKDDEYVKKRLERMKESYIQNAKDIEGIIDERLDSFKGTLGKLKSESKEPGIIWSFDAGDVQEAMKDTISKANTRILMMYPWIRNIDVGILKKFMDTESCIIVQEASLDDDASVELLKLLLDKNVKIRTMPHVHTIAVVADESSGLIISTDPIYESYEVGVVYKDLKSIEEIERLFHDAWEISQEVDLEIKS
ncbi:MAG: hypothetical protein LUQ24_00375 [Methanobacterium sp.]|nr:hypothetical protein [Methanobacterium sp.]